MLKRLIKDGLALAYRKKLAKVLFELREIPLGDLREPGRVAELIRQAGLRHDRRKVYGSDEKSANFLGPGLWQIPGQLAPCLVELSHYPVRRALEIGVADAWTSVFIAAYLSRFNPDLQYLGVDLNQGFPFPAGMSGLAPVHFHFGKTSEDFRREAFDLCFIDGDHSYHWCGRDYENVGQYAKICMFHDINDRLVGSENVPKFWEDLKKKEAAQATFHEFLHHSEGSQVMGIGLRIRNDPATGQ